MLTFNQILRAGGLDPAEVRLVRHTPRRDHHRVVFDAAIRGELAFRTYQESQGSSQIVVQFRAAKHIAGFVVDPLTRQTVFMGIWDRLGERQPTDDGFGSLAQPNWVAFETRLRSDFDDYRGKVVIAWGEGERAWVQRADSQDKPVVELRKEVVDPPFPGFTAFSRPLDQVTTVPASWSEVLRTSRGVDPILHRARGEQYVGSASGEDGFLGRWMTYADGHGGNVAMRELGAAAEAYDVAILEVVGSNATEKEIVNCEEAWKAKLGTRVKGLNRNEAAIHQPDRLCTRRRTSRCSARR